jgi:hypothetical protein
LSACVVAGLNERRQTVTADKKMFFLFMTVEFYSRINFRIALVCLSVSETRYIPLGMLGFQALPDGGVFVPALW